MLSQAVDAKAATIRKILRLLFGASTEKTDTVLPPKDKPPTKSGKKKNKGHGRNGHQEYTAAKQIEVKHPELTPNSPCPECKEGTLYPLKSSVVIRIKGAAPLFGTAYVLEKFRCNLCGKVFTAPLPPEAGECKYDSSAAAMIGLMKYGCGMPFHRLEGLQENLGIPISSSTQWDVIEARTAQLVPVYNELIYQAAQGEVLHNDDTNAKILTLLKENKRDQPKRKGIFTTGVVSLCRGRTITLFFTGRNHARENMSKVLNRRTADKEPPIQMCDALDRNLPQQHITLLTLCLVHARRNFVDAAQHFPEVCSVVLETLAEVYRLDAEAKARQIQSTLGQ